MNTIYKNESAIIFTCIIIIIIFYCLFLIYNRIYKTYTKCKELFLNNDSKRNKMIKLYKDDEILDPDEDPGINVADPDSSEGRDPDS